MNHYDEEKELIRLFEQLPKIKDERSVDQIVRNMNQQTVKRTKQRRLFIPSLATVAALIIFIIAYPTYFQNSEGELVRNSAPMIEEKSMDMAESTKESLLVKENADIDDQNLNPMTTAAYEPEDSSHKLITFGVNTDDAFFIPISMYVPYDGNDDWLRIYKQAAQMIDIERYGFQPFAEMLEALEYEPKTNTVSVTISSDNRPFFINNEYQIMDMLEYTLRNEAVDIMVFRNEQGEPVELGAYGVVQDTPIRKNLKKAHYLFTTLKGEQFIIPADSDSPQFSDAIANMREKPNDFYQPLIPEHIQPIVTEEHGEATVSFKEPIYLDEGDMIAKIRMVEGILLTAKEFGYNQIQFENIEPTHWNRFDFTKPISVPIAANVIEEGTR